MALLTLPGGERVLAAHGLELPQPDQLCGPFSARVALHAVLPAAQVPDLVTLAAAAGTAIWPHDVAEWRPAGAPLDRTGWDELPHASSVHAGGTDAGGLVAGLADTVGDRVAVLPVPGTALTAAALRRLLSDILLAPHPVGVLANVRTGPIAPAGLGWDVGHFVVACSVDLEHDEVMVGDTYDELGAPGMPPGCRRVAVPALAAAMAAPPGRGLLLLTRHTDREATVALVTAAGVSTGSWNT